MSERRSGATAFRSARTASPPTTAKPDPRHRLASLVLHWRNCRDHWARAEACPRATPSQRSAARANQSAYSACLQDLEAVLAGRPLPDRICNG